MTFIEYLVEIEGEPTKGFDTWPECRAHLETELRRKFRPFAITCYRHRNGHYHTLWEIEWTDPSLRATPADRRYLRRIGADPVLNLFRWSIP